MRLQQQRHTVRNARSFEVLNGLQQGGTGGFSSVQMAHGGLLSMARASCAGAGKSSPEFGRISPDAGKLSRYLRAQHPAKTAEAVEAKTGGRVRAEQVRKWLSGSSAPSYAACFTLIAVYGPDLICAVLDSPPEWLSSLARRERLKALDGERERIAAEIASVGGAS